MRKISGITDYVFQDEKLISRPSDSAQGIDLQASEIHAFAFDMGRIVGSITSSLSRISDFMTSDFSIHDIQIFSRDFNTNRCTTLGNEKYKTIRLFLLHVLSTVGFILFVLKKCIIRESGMLLRLEYITYHYALRRIEGIKKFCDANRNAFTDIKLCNFLGSINYSAGNGLQKTDFRNCMMHFQLKNEEGLSLISGNNLDASLPLCGLVETQFDGRSYHEYQIAIEKELNSIYDRLYEYLDFESSLSCD